MDRTFARRSSTLFSSVRRPPAGRAGLCPQINQAVRRIYFLVFNMLDTDSFYLPNSTTEYDNKFI